MKGITEKQQNMYNFIIEFINTEGMAPTVYEIADHFGIKTSTVFAHLRAMQRKGLITRTNKARSIKPCDLTVIRKQTIQREKGFWVSAIASNKNHVDFIAGELERMGCTEVEVYGGEHASS